MVFNVFFYDTVDGRFKTGKKLLVFKGTSVIYDVCAHDV